MSDPNYPPSNPSSNPVSSTGAYAAPIPPYATYDHPTDAPAGSSQPRYLHSEPLPPRSGAFGAAGGGQLFFGPRPGAPVHLPRKSLLLAVVLAGLLGPLGMLYSTLFGAFVMTGVYFWTFFLAGHLLPFVWIWGLVWALWAAHRKNERRRMMEAYLSQS